jgi:hypothetical protein
MTMPLSSDPTKRARQLANLPNLRGEMPAGAWTAGASPALRHGLRTRRPARQILGPAYDELVDVLEDSVPLRGADGQVLPGFAVAIEAAAVQLLQVRRCQAYLETHGATDDRGRFRPENEGLERASDRLLKALDRLGATPTSYARLGFNVMRGADLANAMSSGRQDLVDEALDREEAEGGD